MPPTTVHDYYAILEIPQDAKPAAIRLAYKRLARKKHPDKRINQPNATAEFQLIKEAYDELLDDEKRGEYDVIYKSIIRPRQVKTQKVAEVEQRLRRLGEKRKEPQSLLYNVRKDLIRLHAEMDSVKGERERITREMAAEETWWLYICSFMPSKAADFTRRRQRQTRIMSNMIGKQRTKERDIDRKQEEQRFLKEKIDLITTGERELKAEIRQIERDWQLTASRQERERTLAKQRAQEDLAREFYARNGRNQSNFRYY